MKILCTPGFLAKVTVFVLAVGAMVGILLS
jgi:hypothetical protein